MLSENLARLRKCHGMTQGEVAEKLVVFCHVIGMYSVGNGV